LVAVKCSAGRPTGKDGTTITKDRSKTTPTQQRSRQKSKKEKSKKGKGQGPVRTNGDSEKGKNKAGKKTKKNKIETGEPYPEWGSTDRKKGRRESLKITNMGPA